MEREERAKKMDEARKELLSDNDSVTESLISDKRSSLLSASTARSTTPLRTTRRDRAAEGASEEEPHTNTVLSPRLSATTTSSYRGSPARASSDAGSTSSQRTTIALSSSQRPESPSRLGVRDVKPHRPSPLHLIPTSPIHGLAASPTSPVGPSPPPALPKNYRHSVINSPQKATSLEARWLEKIGQTFEDANHGPAANSSPPKNHEGGMFGITGKELRESWPILSRHLDGKHAIEDVAPREGMKRKRVALLFNAIKEKGWLVVVRHW